MFTVNNKSINVWHVLMGQHTYLPRYFNLQKVWSEKICILSFYRIVSTYFTSLSSDVLIVILKSQIESKRGSEAQNKKQTYVIHCTYIYYIYSIWCKRMTSRIRYDRCLMVVDEHKDIWHGCNFFDGLLYYSEFKSVLKKCYFTIADWTSSKIQL